MLMSRFPQIESQKPHPSPPTTEFCRQRTQLSGSRIMFRHNFQKLALTVRRRPEGRIQPSRQRALPLHRASPEPENKTSKMLKQHDLSFSRENAEKTCTDRPPGYQAASQGGKPVGVELPHPRTCTDRRPSGRQNIFQGPPPAAKKDARRAGFCLDMKFNP